MRPRLYGPQLIISLQPPPSPAYTLHAKTDEHWYGSTCSCRVALPPQATSHHGPSPATSAVRTADQPTSIVAYFDILKQNEHPPLGGGRRDREQLSSTGRTDWREPEGILRRNLGLGCARAGAWVRHAGGQCGRLLLNLALPLLAPAPDNILFFIPGTGRYNKHDTPRAGGGGGAVRVGGWQHLS